MKQFLLILFVALIHFSSIAGNCDAAISPYPTEPEISIFPNPTTNYFEIKHAQQVKQVVIYTMLGAQIKAFATQDKGIYSVMDIPQGLYLVQFLDENQAIIATRRLSKE